MALIWDGNEIEALTGFVRRGKDLSGNVVVIEATFEAVSDFGWPTAWGAAETKYAAGLYEDRGENIRGVKVTKADCQYELSRLD